MGLLGFIFGKDPEWEVVSKATFSTEDIYIYSKGESKQLFKLYLDKLGFSKEGIRDEVELYTKSMQGDEESIKELDGWKPYLIKYINDRVEEEGNKPFWYSFFAFSKRMLPLMVIGGNAPEFFLLIR